MSDQQEIVSNPELDEENKRVEAIEDVEAITKVKEEEIEELLCDIEDVQEVQAILGKVENVAKEALEEGNASTQLGEATHLLLKDLFGRAGIGDDKLLPSVEMFTNPKTVEPAFTIAIESIGIVNRRIGVSVETAQKLIAVKQHELQVAQEAFKDSVKDFFSKKVTTKDVEKISEVASLAKNASNNEVNYLMKEESGLSYYFNKPRALQYLAKGFSVVPNISVGISEDAESINKLTTFMKSVVSEVKKGDSASVEVIKNATQQIGELSFQGGMWIYAGKNKPKMVKRGEATRLKSEESTALGLTFAAIVPTVLPIAGILAVLGFSGGAAGIVALGTAFGAGIGSVVSFFENKAHKKDKIEIEDSLFKGKGQFKSAAQKYSTAMENFAKVANEFLSIKEPVAKSDNSELRDIIRIGNGMISKVTEIAKIAEPFYNKVA